MRSRGRRAIEGSPEVIVQEAGYPATPPDEELAARARTGNQEAFAALYDRHFGGVFDFAFRVTRNHDRAANVMANTFASTWSALRAPRAPENVKAYLYAVARSCAIEALRSRNRGTKPSADAHRKAFDFTRVEPERLAYASAVLADRELVELVWDAAEALSPEEYSLLDLHIRRQLGADELADQLGLKNVAVSKRLAALRDGFDDAVKGTLIARQGREAVASPVEILGSFALMPPPPGLQREIWRRVDPDVDARSKPAHSGRRRFPWRKHTRGR